MPFQYEDGALVEVRGETWRLARRQCFDSCAILTLEGRDRSNAGVRVRVIDPFDRPRPIASPRLRKVSRRTAIAAALASIAHVRHSSGLWTAAAATIDLWPYQLEPALAVVAGATRVLLADAVGLGKTIQAGLILSELRERGWIEHALIVCPAGLRDTWAGELRQRFHIAATILDQASIAERMASLPPGVSPWSGHGVAIASIDFIKRAEVLAAIDREPVDLLIADEAHHLVPGTDRGAAVSRLAARAPWCVLLSATPHSGDRAAFEYLTSMGAAGDAITIFRRHRRDANLAESRRTHLLPVRPSADEAALLIAIEHYARAIWMARGRDQPAVRLIAMTMARRAASSTAAIARTIERRRALLAGIPIEPAQAALPWDDTDGADDLEADTLLAAAGLADPREEDAALAHLTTLATRCTLSTKFQRLQRLLDSVREPAVVFTEYRDTLEALVVILAPSRRVVSIHGGLGPEARRGAVEAFNGGRADVLIATDAAGEGLNLHHRCRLVIDLELPWNPLRLEQRVGRVDRLGQRRTVHAIRLFHPDTIESAVLDHLRIRRRRAEEALDPSIRDTAVAAAIFDGASPIAADVVVIEGSSMAASRQEAERIVRQRRIGNAASKIVTAPRRSRRPTIAVRRTLFINGAGYSIGEEIDALRLALAGRPRSRREWRALVDRIEAIACATPIVPILDVAVRRIACIRSNLARARAVRYQRSLFDRRADVEAAERETVAAALDEALARILRSLDPVAATQRTELAALWPERRR